MKFVILMSSDDAAWDALAPAEQARVMEAHSACERESAQASVRGSAAEP